MAAARHLSLPRLAGLAFAATAFAAAPAMFAYLAFFLGNLWPHAPPLAEPSVDAGATFPPPWAALNDAALLALFALQHSLMARSGFKAWQSRFVPRGLERGCYVMTSNVALALLLAFWRPVPITLYELEDGVLEDLVWSVFILGWMLLLAGLVAIGPLDLLGLNQARAWFHGRPYAEPPLKSSGLFARLRHPLYAALLICLWATPHMTAGHALFAAAFSLYIAVGMRLEERGLLRRFGKAYDDYRARTPALLPRLFR